jgi:tetratricopeptide (TPR) repeat protein
VAFDLLAHLTTAGTMDLNGWLANLQQHEILRETQRAPELVFAFTHALMQEVCYTSLPVSTRRDHHQRIATYLETAHGEAESHIPLVAYHAFAGQDWPRALRFQRRAGEEAQKLFANQEAALHFQRALESAAHLPAEATAADRQQAHLGLGELLTTTAQYETALEHLNQAVALAEAQSDVDGAARACRWLARLHELRGDYPQAFRFIDQGLGYLDGRATPEAAQLRLFAGLIYSRQGDYEKMRQEGEQARALAQALGEKTAVARADSLLGMFDLQSGSGAEAIQHFEQALGLYQAAGDLAGQATVHNLVGSAHFEMSRFTEADRAYRQARVIFEQIGDVYNRAFADNNLGEIALYQGRVDEALRFYQAALDSFEQIGGSPYVLGVLHMNLGASFIRQGEAGPAREHLGASQRYFEQAGGRDFLPEMNRHLARAALIAGQSEAAAAHIDEALRLAREMGMRAEEGNGLRVQGEIYRQQQRLPDAQLALQQSVAVLSELEQPFELARSRFSLARVQAEMGERAAARASLDQVIPVFERLEAALDLQAAQALRAQLAA